MEQFDQYKYEVEYWDSITKSRHIHYVWADTAAQARQKVETLFPGSRVLDTEVVPD